MTTMTTMTGKTGKTGKTGTAIAPEPTTTATGRPGRTLLLTIWVEFVGLFGLASVLVPWLREDFFYWLATGSTDTPFDAAAQDFVTLTMCIIGALTVALAVGMWFLVRFPLRRGERWSWYAVLATVGTWFVIDSLASIATGFERNAVANAVIVLCAVPGLLVSRPR